MVVIGLIVTTIVVQKVHCFGILAGLAITFVAAFATALLADAAFSIASPVPLLSTSCAVGVLRFRSGMLRVGGPDEVVLYFRACIRGLLLSVSIVLLVSLLWSQECRHRPALLTGLLLVPQALPSRTPARCSASPCPCP